MLFTGLQTTPAAQQAMGDIQKGNYLDAAKLLGRALETYPRDPELWNLLGIADTETGKVKDAQDAFAHGLNIAPDSVSLNENAGLLFFRQARYAEAKKRLARAVELGSEKPGVKFSLAASKLRSGEPAAALADLRALEPTLANVREYWEERGRAELPHSASDAEASFERALQLAPQSPAALNGAAAAAEREGADEKALAYLIRARGAAPDDAETLLHFASVCLRRDLGPDAIEAAERARQLAPNNLSAIYLLARANISVQNWQRAFELFRELSEKRPRFAPAYYALGWIDLKLGRVNDARGEIEHSLALDPKQTDARYDLAQLELDDGNLTKARTLLETVLREDPNYAKANMALGDIEMRGGRLDRARELLEKAILKEPKLAAAHYKLAILYTRQHETDKAARERTIAAQLTAEEKQESKTQLRLVLPD